MCVSWGLRSEAERLAVWKWSPRPHARPEEQGKKAPRGDWCLGRSSLCQPARSSSVLDHSLGAEAADLCLPGVFIALFC